MSNEDDRNEAAARELTLEFYRDHYRNFKPADEFEQGIIAEALQLTAFIASAGTRAFCILLCSFVEDTFKRNFINKWKIASKDQQSIYFGGNGPLSTFSQRMLIATGIGWLSSEAHAEMSLIRKIRNEFAHNHRVHSLDTDPLASWARGLKQRETAWNKDEMPLYKDAYSKVDTEIKLRLRYLCASFWITSSFLTRSKLLAAGMPAEFRNPLGWSGYSEVEQELIECTIRACFHALGIPRSGAAR